MNKDEQGKEKIARKGMAIKVQAVEEFENGTAPITDLVQKYGITRATLYNWRQQVKKKPNGRVFLKKYSEEIRLQIVKDIVTKGLTIQEAADRYSVSKKSIKNWCLKYSCQLSSLDDQKIVAKKQEEKSRAEVDRIHQLEKALEEANLKIIGLETMINIAEADLKIDIRKKPGTKQSK